MPQIKSNFLTIAALAALILLGAGCSTPRPVLYPNRHYQQVGRVQAQKDIDAALNLAREQGLDHSSAKNKQLYSSTARSASRVGASTAASAISGGLGSGSIAGAAVTGSSCAMDWIFSSSEPDPLFRRFVEYRLKQQGYMVLGWK